MTSPYDKAAQEMAKLPRAERFDSLLDFPLDFSFKAIGLGPKFSGQVRELLDSRGHPDVILVERPSKQGRYVSITFKLHVHSGADIDAVFTALEALPDLKLIL